MKAQPLQLFLTVEHDCGYLPNLKSASLVPDPKITMTMPLYSQLIQHGYRRSGSQTYRPHCRNCEACVACRLPVARFKPNRNQRRCLKANQDLEVTMVKARFTEEYFQLYKHYLNTRHNDGDMANPTHEDFKQFLFSDWSETVFIELRKDRRLIAIAVLDIVSDGLSAVYTFFDPTEKKRSLGTYCILLEIEQAKRMQLDYLYMGYWIENCQKMLYKSHFKPMAYFLDDTWEIKD